MDLISRKQAIDDIWTVSPLARLDRKWVDRWLRQLPSAQPKRGKWIHDGSKWTNRWICSECGYKWFFNCIEGAYCPNCGTDMRGEQYG